eukprot:gene3588-4108_t
MSATSTMNMKDSLTPSKGGGLRLGEKFGKPMAPFQFKPATPPSRFSGNGSGAGFTNNFRNNVAQAAPMAASSNPYAPIANIKDPFGNSTIYDQKAKPKISPFKEPPKKLAVPPQPVAPPPLPQPINIDAQSVDDDFTFDFDDIDVPPPTTTTTTTTTTTKQAPAPAPLKTPQFAQPPPQKKPQQMGLRTYAPQYPDIFQLPAEEDDPPPEMDMEAIKTYIYPKREDMGVREYQSNIISHLFYQNTMVCLPTGLGKTFIASVAILNFYRWFPGCKIVFLVHSRPLVAQQIEAFHQITGIPQHESILLTGTVKANDRESKWRERRIFFCTPQVFVNDIEKNRLDPSQIRLIVLDEAHKAHGNFDYCVGVRLVANRTRHFRVLALTASPGTKKDSVQEVIDNLLISQMEVRSERSLDIIPYIHQKKIEVVVVDLPNSIQGLFDILRRIQSIPYNKLVSGGAIPPAQTLEKLSIGYLRVLQDNYTRSPRHNYGVSASFYALQSLLAAANALTGQGMEAFNEKLKSIQKPKRMTAPFKELHGSPAWAELLAMTNEAMSSKVVHEKLVKLSEIVIAHFNNSKDKSTRVMVFVELRDTVAEIVDYLGKKSSLIKVMPFYGQSDGKRTKGLNQGEQASILTRFRDGGYNTLISTSIGEEGLDFGEVDLIVCFDTPQSAVRNIQQAFDKSHGAQLEKRKIKKESAFLTGEELRYLNNNYADVSQDQDNMSAMMRNPLEYILKEGKWTYLNYMKTPTHIIDKSLQRKKKRVKKAHHSANAFFEDEASDGDDDEDESFVDGSQNLDEQLPTTAAATTRNLSKNVDNSNSTQMDQDDEAMEDLRTLSQIDEDEEIPDTEEEEEEESEDITNTQDEIDDSYPQQQQQQKLRSTTTTVVIEPKKDNNEDEEPVLRRAGSSTFIEKFNVNVWTGNATEDGDWSLSESE